MQERPTAGNSALEQQLVEQPSVDRLDVAPRVVESAPVDNSFLAEQTKGEQRFVGKSEAAEPVEQKLVFVVVQLPIGQTGGTVAGTLVVFAAT